MRQIEKLVIHCTDSDDSLDIGKREIDQWHKQRGWAGIGYHYVIRRNGVVERGREDDVSGAHVRGHNSNSLGIVWVGRKDPSDRQITSLKAIVRGLCNQYGLDVTEDVFGHYELDPKKTCPNINMVHFRADLIFLPGGIVGDFE